MSEDLFAGLAGPVGRGYEERAQPLKSVAWGGCPGCLNNKVGLAQVTGHLSWKDHNRTTWGGASMQCSVTGQHLCDYPARDVESLTGVSTPHCPHEKVSTS